MLLLQRLQVPIRSNFFIFFCIVYAEFECASLLSAWKRTNTEVLKDLICGQSYWIFKIQIDMWGLDPVAER